MIFANTRAKDAHKLCTDDATISATIRVARLIHIYNIVRRQESLSEETHVSQHGGRSPHNACICTANNCSNCRKSRATREDPTTTTTQTDERTETQVHKHDAHLSIRPSSIYALHSYLNVFVHIYIVGERLFGPFAYFPSSPPTLSLSLLHITRTSPTCNPRQTRDASASPLHPV